MGVEREIDVVRRASGPALRAPLELRRQRTSRSYFHNFQQSNGWPGVHDDARGPAVDVLDFALGRRVDAEVLSQRRSGRNPPEAPQFYPPQDVVANEHPPQRRAAILDFAADNVGKRP